MSFSSKILSNMMAYSTNDPETMPSSKDEFKNSAKYVLESQLKKFEAFNPFLDQIVGNFHGDIIHLRSSLERIRSKDAWMTQFGRSVSESSSPVKEYDLNVRKRNGEVIVKKQALFGKWQTVKYEPPGLMEDVR